MSKNAIILMGIKHSGKSTQGKLLAEHLKCDFFDTDELIENLTKKTPRQLYNECGVKKFMEAECDVCKKIAFDYVEKQIVVATGGGISDNGEALKALRPLGKFVFLKIDENIAFERITKNIEFVNDEWQNIPAYISKENPKTYQDIQTIFHKFYERRNETYEQIADITICIKDASKEENAKIIADALTIV